MEIKKLDFSKCKYVYDVHQELKRGLNFPDYYGENWDALWDCLTDINEPTYVEIFGFNSLCEDVAHSKEKMIEIFDRCVKTLDGFTYKIIS